MLISVNIPIITDRMPKELLTMDAVDVGERVCSEPGDLKYPSRYYSKSMMLVSWCRGVLSIMASIVIWGPSAAQLRGVFGGLQRLTESSR